MSATPKKWSNVQVLMQNALGAEKEITAISKASEGVVTSAAHGFANGQFVRLKVEGMYQLDQRIVRVSAQTAGTYKLEGVDTTLFETFTSGSAEAVTYGTSIVTATTMNPSGGEFSFIDTTTIHAKKRTQIPDIPTAAAYAFDNIWSVDDPGLIAMRTASDQQALRAFKFRFGDNGPQMVFNGFVGASLLPGGSALQLVTAKAVITMDSDPTYYAS